MKEQREAIAFIPVIPRIKSEGRLSGEDPRTAIAAGRWNTCISSKGAMQVAKWGTSLAVRLPAAVVEVLELKPGDDIEIQVAGQREFLVSRKPGREEMLERLRAFRGRLPPDFKFDRDEANAR